MAEIIAVTEDGILDLRRRRIKKIDPAQSAHSGCSVLLTDHNDLARLDNVDTYGSLEKLSASHNQLIRMYGVGRLYSLRHLNLSYNNIGTIEGLRDLSHLTYLNLAGNNIKTIEHLNHSKELQFVDLSENAITNIVDLSFLKSLKKLFLHGNRIKSLQFAEKYFPTSLDTVTLAENQIADLNEISRLCHLVNVEQFSFAGNPCITGNDLEFDYRPYAINWLLSVKILDGELVNEKERLKGEWLYSQGKGRFFKPGEHESTVEYLNRHFPSPKLGRVISVNENEEDRLEKILRMSKMHHSVPTLNIGSDEDESSASMSARSNSTSLSSSRRVQEIGQHNTGSPGGNRKPIVRKVAPSAGASSVPAVPKRRSQSPDEGSATPTRRSVEKSLPNEDLMSRSFDPATLRSFLRGPQVHDKTTHDKPIKKQLLPELTAPRTPKKNSVRSTDEDFSDLSDVCDPGEVLCGSLTLKKDATRTLIPHPKGSTSKSPNNTIPRPKRSISVQPRAGNKPKSPSPGKDKEESSDSDHKTSKPPKVPPRTIPSRSRSVVKAATEEDKAALTIQKVWRGYQTRNLDPKVAKVKEEIRHSRAEKHILSIQDELKLARQQLEEEKRLRNEQSHLVAELTAKVKSLETRASVSTPESVNSTTMEQLAETCSQLQKQVNQLQSCVEGLTRALEAIGHPSRSNVRPTSLEIHTEQRSVEPESPDAPGEVKEFAKTMVKQLITQAVMNGERQSSAGGDVQEAKQQSDDSEKEKDEKEESSSDETESAE